VRTSRFESFSAEPRLRGEREKRRKTTPKAGTGGGDGGTSRPASETKGMGDEEGREGELGQPISMGVSSSVDGVGCSASHKSSACCARERAYSAVVTPLVILPKALEAS